jgi:hypothetical protein
VDNGFGGSMCNGLCRTPLASECEAVPTDLQIAECRFECADEALVIPGLLSCFGDIDCNAPDFSDQADACENIGEQLIGAPPPFESVGVHLYVAEGCGGQ